MKTQVIMGENYDASKFETVPVATPEEVAAGNRTLHRLDGRQREQVEKAFRELHTRWLSATKRQDMNEEMDALAVSLGLDPLTLKPPIVGDQRLVLRRKSDERTRGGSCAPAPGSEMWELAWKTGSVEGGCGRRTREEVEYAVRRALFEGWDSITITRTSPNVGFSDRAN